MVLSFIMIGRSGLLLIALLLVCNVALSQNVALILDATGSLAKYGTLSKYIDNVKTLIEIIAAVESNPEITIAKFGAVGESEIIYSGRLSLRDRQNILKVFELIDENLEYSKLYKNKTSFYEGFKKILSETPYSFDTTIFITDGLDNDSRKTLQDLLNEYGSSIQKLGRIIFVFVPPTGIQQTEEAKKIIKTWTKHLRADLLITTQQNFVERIVKSFLKKKVENYIFGYGYKLLKGSISIDKYYDDSKVVLIITPPVQIRSSTASVYNGLKLTYVEIKGNKGQYTLDLTGSRRSLVFYYETAGFTYKFNVEPKRSTFFKGESIKYRLKFLANGKEIVNPFFEKTLFVQLKVNKREFKPRRYIDTKIGTLSLDKPGKAYISIKYSYFLDSLKNKHFQVVYTPFVKRESGVLSVYINEKDVYEYQKFNIDIVPIGLNLNKNSLMIELLNLDRGGRKLVTLFREGNKFTAFILLPTGTYEVKPLGNFLVGGARVFKVKRRNIILKMYKLNQKYILKHEDRFSSSERNLVAFVDLEYALTDNDKEIYKLELSVTPMFTDEKLIVSYDKEIYTEINFKGKKYYPVPIMYGRNIQSKLFIKGTYEGLQNSNSFTYSINIERSKNVGIEKLETESAIKVANIKGIAIDSGGEVNKLGSYNIYLQFNVIGKKVFLAKRWASFIGYLIAFLVIAVLVIIWKLKQLRTLQHKRELLRLISELHPEDFKDLIPYKVLKLLNGDAKRLKTLHSDPDLLDKVAKAWDSKKLKEFYEKLNQPIDYIERELNIGESLAVGYMPEGDDDVRLRDRSVDVYVDVKVRTEKGDTILEAYSMAGFMKIGANTVTRFSKKIIPGDIIDIEIPNYVITVKVLASGYKLSVKRTV